MLCPTNKFADTLAREWIRPYKWIMLYQVKIITGVTNKDVSSGCYGPRDVSGTSGLILSHQNAGQDSYTQSECVWVIGPSPGTQTTLTFNSFDLENSDSCKYDSLKVSVYLIHLNP